MIGAPVVDTCIVLAASLPDEPHHVVARQFMEEHEGQALACDIIHVEIINGLMKAARRKRLTPEAAIERWQDSWVHYEWAEILPSQPNLAPALALSVKYPLHVYDLLHLLAAREAGRTLITLDRKFHEQAKAARLGKWVRVLG